MEPPFPAAQGSHSRGKNFLSKEESDVKCFRSFFCLQTLKMNNSTLEKKFFDLSKYPSISRSAAAHRVHHILTFAIFLLGISHHKRILSWASPFPSSRLPGHRFRGAALGNVKAKLITNFDLIANERGNIRLNVSVVHVTDRPHFVQDIQDRIVLIFQYCQLIRNILEKFFVACRKKCKT